MLVSQFTKERFGTASAVAASLECRFGTSYAASDIVMAAGADSGINAFMDAVLKPEDEVIAFAPCGQTYHAIVEGRGARLVEVPLDEETMLPDFVALECALTSRTKLVIVSAPNDPNAMAYPEAVADGIAGALFRAQRAFGRTILLLSDEAHSDMANGEVQNPWWPAFYRNSAVVRTSDVSASVVGEPAEYVALTREMAGRGDVVAGIRRALREANAANAADMAQRVTVLPSAAASPVPFAARFAPSAQGCARGGKPLIALTAASRVSGLQRILLWPSPLPFCSLLDSIFHLGLHTSAFSGSVSFFSMRQLC